MVVTWENIIDCLRFLFIRLVNCDLYALFWTPLPVLVHVGGRRSHVVLLQPVLVIAFLSKHLSICIFFAWDNNWKSSSSIISSTTLELLLPANHVGQSSN